MILNFFWQLFFDVSLMEGTYLEISQKNYYFKDPVIFFIDENFSSRTSSRKYSWSAAMCPISKSTKSLHPIKGWGRWRGRRGGGGGLAKLCFVWTHLIGGGRAPPNSPSPRQVPRISGLTLVRGKKMNKKKQKVLGWFLPRPWIPSLGNHDMYEYVSF